MRLILVEDDYYDAEQIVDELTVRLQCTIEVVRTEKQFVELFDKIASNAPDFVIFDIMLPWDMPKPDMDDQNVPIDVARDGFFRAGERCAARLRGDRRTADVPYVFFTGLSLNNFASDVPVVTKSDDLDDLVSFIKRGVRRR